MIILGLAGHVDHGKTALVRALTGTDTDRLPEEKARGMTTDLGFAAMELDYEGRHLEIGVVDVPGHERYIRNMVAGAWALDLVLLVVAADDGWMYQTENHARALAALGRPRILMAITKADKVSPGALAQVEEDCCARAISVFGQASIAGSYPTSIISGLGIEELKDAIGREGALLESTRRTDGKNQPFLYIDRIFSRLGAGLVICGTLVGGSVSVDEELQIHPSADIVRIKSIESLGRKHACIEAPARVAFNVSKPRKNPNRGDFVTYAGTRGTAFFSGTEFLVKVSPLPRSKPEIPGQEKADPIAEVLRKGGEVEIAAGSADVIASIAPLGKGSWYRLICRKDIAVQEELPIAIIRHGGADILGKGSIMREGKTDKASRRILVATLAGLESLPVPIARLAMKVQLEGRVRDCAEILTGSLSLEELKDLGIVLRGRDALERRTAEAEDKKKGQDSHQGEALPHELSAAATLLRQRGPAGVDISLPPGPGTQASSISRKVIQGLCAAGIATPLDRDIFLHREIYDALAGAVLEEKAPGDRLEIAEVKMKTGYSRKYVIPFLNRMERDGYVKRDGDSRIVLSRTIPVVPRQLSTGLPNT